MKKSFLLFVLSVVTISSMLSQTVNDVPLSDIKVEFVQILGISKSLSNKVTITIDFGQQNKYFSFKDVAIIKDKKGKKIKFYSMIDALNFMSENGYEFVDSNMLRIDKENVFQYLLKRKK